MRPTEPAQPQIVRPQIVRPWTGPYLYGSDRAGTAAPSAFSGGAAGGFVR
jgi:hypothetical protein